MTEERKPIEKGKTYRTRSGLEVDIYAVDRGGELPVHGGIRGVGGEWDAKSWTVDGFYFSDGTISEDDIIEVRPEKWAYLNVYESGDAYGYNSRATADRCASHGRIGCARLNLEEFRGRFDD